MWRDNTKKWDNFRLYFPPKVSAFFQMGGLFPDMWVVFQKGAGVFRRPGQNVEDLCKIGTSRTSNELKIGP